jgi:hypothetical protein
MKLPDYTAILLEPQQHLAAYGLLAVALLLLATTLWVVSDNMRTLHGAATLFEWVATAVAGAGWWVAHLVDLAPAACVFLISSVILTINAVHKARVA